MQAQAHAEVVIKQKAAGVALTIIGKHIAKQADGWWC
jgi:hypothetical protein